MPIGIPGCPELAFCTASIASARIALAIRFGEEIEVMIAKGSGRGTARSQALLQSRIF
jgi:hypothetical protein